MEKTAKIYIAGHTGLVGSALMKKLSEEKYSDIITKTHSELDLLDQKSVKEFFEKKQPEYVFLAAARVGGIQANNTFRGQFIFENMQIQNNIIHYSYLSKVKKLMFLGSSCIYPKNSPQPIKEAYLLTGELEYTNEPYAIAKIAGMKMCESYNIQYGTNFLMVMPTNLYGPNDNFDLNKSHVLPALIRKIHLAKLFSEGKDEEINKDLKTGSFAESMQILNKAGIEKDHLRVWGTGTPRREFLHSEDMAEACVFLMKNVNFPDLVNNEKEIKNTHINIGTGKDISIRELAELIKEMIRYNGELVFDPEKPDGTKQKLLDVSKLNSYGWKEKIKLKDGIKSVYENYLINLQI
jgi:GDP-L-fucose synthase